MCTVIRLNYNVGFGVRTYIKMKTGREIIRKKETQFEKILNHTAEISIGT